MQLGIKFGESGFGNVCKGNGIMNDLKNIIERCLKSSKPPVVLYAKEDNGSYYKINDGVVADNVTATENLQTMLGPFLKDEEEQGEIDKLKSEIAYLKGEITAYEKFLKRNGIITDNEDEE